MFYERRSVVIYACVSFLLIFKLSLLNFGTAGFASESPTQAGEQDVDRSLNSHDCAKPLSNPITVYIQNSEETSILYYSGPPITPSKIALRFFARTKTNSKSPRDDLGLPRLELFHDPVANIGAIISRNGEPHQNLYEMLVQPVKGTPLGGSRWFSVDPVSGQIVLRVPSMYFKHLEERSPEHRFKIVVVSSLDEMK